MKHNFDYNKDYVPLAQNLRSSMTPEEKKLWYRCLSLLPIPAHRQKNIGNYIVDFYIPRNQIVIELDGIQHTSPEGIQADKIRDEYLDSLGITVLRYTNVQINENFKEVVGDILRHIGLDDPGTYDYIETKFRKKWDRQ